MGIIIKSDEKISTERFFIKETHPLPTNVCDVI